MSKTSGAGLSKPPSKNKDKAPQERLSFTGRLGKTRRQAKRKSAEKTQLERDAEALAAKVVTLWIAGRTLFEISQELDVSVSTIQRIKNECPAEIIQLVEHAKSEKITVLVERGLEENLLAMNRIVEVTKDDQWVKSQRAPELATLFGVISDKTVRILAAIERAAERQRLEQRGPVREFEDLGSRTGPAEATVGA